VSWAVAVGLTSLEAPGLSRGDDEINRATAALRADEASSPFRHREIATVARGLFAGIDGTSKVSSRAIVSVMAGTTVVGPPWVTVITACAVSPVNVQTKGVLAKLPVTWPWLSAKFAVRKPVSV
jgi:hypothetical protein